MSGNQQPPQPQSKSDEDRGPRWQKISLDYRTYAVNLFLTLTVAAIAYWFTLLKDDKFTPGSTVKCAFLVSFIGLAVAGISGVVCVIIRVYDFRGTARRASGHPEKPSKDAVRMLDSCVHWAFLVQAVSFACGLIAFAVALLLNYGGKLV